jgi:UDP-glucose 4-epimerase
VPNVGLRFFNVFGPRQDARSPYSGVISKFVDLARRGENLTIFGDGEQTRDFIYVADIVELMLRAAHRDANCELLNGCTGTSVSVNALAKTILRIAGAGSKIVHAPARTGDIKHSLGSPLKAQNILDFSATTALEGGLLTLLEKTYA